jgi:GT2 family glycosyltransferase
MNASVDITAAPKLAPMTAPSLAPSLPPGTPARERLRLRGRGAVPWAVFYPDWYAQTYPDAVGHAGARNFQAALQRYLDFGQQAGHSPTPYFDEAWYRTAYPGVAAAIAEGAVESGFDHYCRSGFRDRSPHWLFNEHHYRRHNADLTDDALAAEGLPNGYAHYLRVGDREGRSGSPFFDPRIYRAHATADVVATIDAEGGFIAFLRHLGDRTAECRTTWYFDPDWYRATYPDVAAAIAAGQWHSGLHHYLTNDTPTAFDPLPAFSEQDYLARYPDIAAAVEAGHWRNGYAHFLANGAAELRTPSTVLDPRWYMATHATVRDDLAAGRAPDAFTHYLAIGAAAGLPAVPPPDLVAVEADDLFTALFHARAQTLIPTIARAGLDFTLTAAPTLSVIMLLRDRFALTLQSLAALRDQCRGEVELILIDCASTDETRHILRYVRGARLIRFDMAIDPAVARNAALQAVGASTVILLSNETALAHGAIDAAMRRLDSDQGIGAVGGKVLGPDAILFEAGGIIWRDGSLLPYLRGAAATIPEANFVRDVDYCSSAFLAVRTALLQQLGGFDEAYGWSTHADADLCVRLVTAGHRVVYDPSVVLFQLAGEAASSTDKDLVEAFFRKHINHLRFRYLTDPKVEVFARAIGARRQRVLFIEDLVPLRMIGSGFVRSNDLIRTMVSMDVFVTVYPINRGDFDPASIYADLPDAAEVMHDRSLADLDAFLAERAGYYDLIWVARTHNLDRILTRLTRSTTGSGRPPRVVLDTEAIAALRDAAHRQLSQPVAPFDLDAAILKEFANAHFCQNIAAVTEREAATLRALGFADTVVVGHIRDLTPTPRAFAERAGMLFVGAIHEMDSPNYDALRWFVDEVLPLIERQLGWETRLSIVGYTGADVSLDRFKDHPRVTLRGAVADTEPLYNAHRIFVAPTRYAAGTPYKIYEAASFGLPVVATSLLREQTGWEDGKELLAADSTDPVAFARQIVTLYRDEAMWQSLRDNALARLATENSREHYVQALTTILERA